MRQQTVFVFNICTINSNQLKIYFKTLGGGPHFTSKDDLFVAIEDRLSILKSMLDLFFVFQTLKFVVERTSYR
jgi:hypothetical protein